MKQQQPLPTILNGNELVCELHPKLIDSVGDTVLPLTLVKLHKPN